MRFEVRLIPIDIEINRDFALAFDDQDGTLTTQYFVSRLKKGEKGVVLETVPIGTISKDDIKRLAKAT